VPETCKNEEEHTYHYVGSDPDCHNCHVYLQQRYGSIQAARPDFLQLDPTDKFDRVIIEMVEMNRKKRRDYAADTDIFSNFRDVAGNLGVEGFGPAESAYVLLLTKVARLRSLRVNGRMADPSNESVLDTFLDLAVYAAIVLALVKEATDDSTGTDA